MGGRGDPRVRREGPGAVRPLAPVAIYAEATGDANPRQRREADPAAPSGTLRDAGQACSVGIAAVAIERKGRSR
jgi:hypothetical protein